MRRGMRLMAVSLAITCCALGCDDDGDTPAPIDLSTADAMIDQGEPDLAQPDQGGPDLGDRDQGELDADVEVDAALDATARDRGIDASQIDAGTGELSWGRCDVIDALELNISCPNIKEGGITFGTDCIAAAGFFSERWQPQKAE